MSSALFHIFFALNIVKCIIKIIIGLANGLIVNRQPLSTPVLTHFIDAYLYQLIVNVQLKHDDHLVTDGFPSQRASNPQL